MTSESAQACKNRCDLKSPLLIYAAIGIIGCMVTVIVAYGYWVGYRLSRLDEPLVDAAKEIKLEATASMLWLEDALKAGPSEMPHALWDQVDQALWYLEAGLRKKEIPTRYRAQSPAADMAAALESVHAELNSLKRSASEYASDPSNPTYTNRYKEICTIFFALVDQLGTKLDLIRGRSIRRFQVVQTFLMLTSIAVFVAIGLFYRRFERQRASHLAHLRQSNAELEKEMLIRLEAERALKNIQEQLEDKVSERTAELKRINAELTEQISQRRRAEQDLLANSAMLQAIFNGISDPLILFDKDMRIRMMNQSALTYYGMQNPDEGIGKLCREIVSSSCSCEACEIPVSVSRGLASSFERPGLMDPLRVEQVTIYPVFNGTHKPSDAILRISDITESKLLQKRVMLSEKMASLGILVSSIAHEINNPNSFISFNMPILREYLDGLMPMLDRYAESRPGFELFNMPYEAFKKDLFKMLDNIEHGSQRISAFVLNLREFSENREFKPNRLVAIENVIEKAVEICRNKMKHSVGSFEVKVPQGLAPVYTEPAALEQILINLLINAAQAADKEASWVRLHVFQETPDSGDLTIEVSDNGCGMDESMLKKIFDPFFTTKALGEGTGLGLYVCQNMAESIGARIEVKSTPGIGSLFKVLVPNHRSVKPKEVA